MDCEDAFDGPYPLAINFDGRTWGCLKGVANAEAIAFLLEVLLYGL